MSSKRKSREEENLPKPVTIVLYFCCAGFSLYFALLPALDSVCHAHRITSPNWRWFC